MTQKSVTNTTPNAVLDVCSKSGIDIDNLLSKTKLSKDKIENLNGRTSFEDVINLWDESFHQTKDRMIGVKAAGCLPFGAFKIIDYIFASSLTPKDGLFRFSSYYPLVNDGFVAQIKLKGDFGYLELHNSIDPKILPFQYVDFVFACILNRVRFSTGINWNPIKVNLTCSEPKDTSEYHQFFQVPIEFNQVINQLVFEKDMLNLLQPNADSTLCEMLDNHAQNLLRNLPSEKDLLVELSEIVRKNLPYGKTDLGSSARKLGMSRRSLQRNLKRQGISYRELLNKVRFELATNLLSQKDISIEETAFLVGYSERSSFHRAFKQWTGKTPQDFMNH